MSDKPTGGKPRDPGEAKGNDLTAIKGIGPARQQWLRDSLGIHTFQDLAALSADEVEARLKAGGQVASRGEIEGWITQAEALAAVPDQLRPEVAEAGPTQAVSKADAPHSVSEWLPVASFVVEFQTRRAAGRETEMRTTVHYMEADQNKAWSGLTGEPLCQWMLGQLSARVDLPATHKQELEARAPVSTGTTPPSRTSISLSVGGLRVFQPADTEEPVAVGQAGQPFVGFVRGNRTLALEADFELVGAAAAEAAQTRRPYHAQFYAHNISTGETLHLGDTKLHNLTPGRLSYTAALSDITLSPGMYRLRTLVTVRSRPPTMGFLEVPLLQAAQAWVDHSTGCSHAA